MPDEEKAQASAKYIADVGKELKELSSIHGWHSLTALLDMLIGEATQIAQGVSDDYEGRH